ncbi:PREDICTED: putative gustatory receptor 28a [Wasmannia auropunctata]|uniref:putative gustatory receptor 28a n=1 Tax=Wasmannia auropunctata TaxID=64793 RepID=UPI0005F02B8F|nr:PREDICTED: putative gustatory receptor 28a [Wasmannia auropunctata]XP_011705729.1 PREDICTED: putative gustatory receptor 28a [Wasmannia auropunctata]
MRKRWRLFHATDFKSLMYPCFTFCRILGIFPYRINNSTFEASESCYILSTIVICAFCVYGIVIFYELDISGTIMYISVPRSLERHSYYLLGVFTAIVTYVLRGPRLLLLQTILEISSKLPSESYQKLSRLIYVKDIFSFLFVIGLGLICCIKMPLNTLVLTMFALYLSLLLLQMDMMYMNCVCVLKFCFKKINDNLVKVQELVMSDEPHLLRRTYHEQRNPFLLMTLKALKKQHLMVSDTLQMLNTIFSLQIIVTVVLSFAEITFNLYFYIVLSMAKEEEEFWYWFFIMSVIYHAVKIVLIVWACDSGKDQAARIGVTVHDMLNSTNDKQIKDELELFSMQILHRENTFSAKGLTVDATLLTAMVGSITTYLLILIQFLVTSHSCDGRAISIIEVI